MNTALQKGKKEVMAEDAVIMKITGSFYEMVALKLSFFLFF